MITDAIIIVLAVYDLLKGTNFFFFFLGGVAMVLQHRYFIQKILGTSTICSQCKIWQEEREAKGEQGPARTTRKQPSQTSQEW